MIDIHGIGIIAFQIARIPNAPFGHKQGKPRINCLVRDVAQILSVSSDVEMQSVGNVRVLNGIADHIIDALLEWDIEQAEQDVLAVYPWVSRLDPVRRATLVAMEFQLPVRGLASFPRSMEAMRVGDWPLAATRFLQSKVAREQAPARWQRFAKQIRTGQWQ